MMNIAKHFDDRDCVNEEDINQCLDAYKDLDKKIGKKKHEIDQNDFKRSIEMYNYFYNGHKNIESNGTKIEKNKKTKKILPKFKIRPKSSLYSIIKIFTDDELNKMINAVNGNPGSFLSVDSLMLRCMQSTNEFVNSSDLIFMMSAFSFLYGDTYGFVHPSVSPFLVSKKPGKVNYDLGISERTWFDNVKWKDLLKRRFIIFPISLQLPPLESEVIEERKKTKLGRSLVNNRPQHWVLTIYARAVNRIYFYDSLYSVMSFDFLKDRLIEFFDKYGKMDKFGDEKPTIQNLTQQRYILDGTGKKQMDGHSCGLYSIFYLLRFRESVGARPPNSLTKEEIIKWKRISILTGFSLNNRKSITLDSWISNRLRPSLNSVYKKMAAEQDKVLKESIQVITID